MYGKSGSQGYKRKPNSKSRLVKTPIKVCEKDKGYFKELSLEDTKMSKQPVTIYWWNFGSRQLDYDGTYQGYMNKRNIVVENIVHPRNSASKGLRFTHDWGTAKIIYESYDSDVEHAYFNAIQMFLTIMGDKAKIISNRWESKVNWRA